MAHSARRNIIISQASGPPVEGSGFFYDAFIGNGKNSIPISTKTLSALETYMRKLSTASHPFERCRVTPSAAAAMFAGNVFKERIINAASARGEQLTVYRCGPFVDLCRYAALNCHVWVTLAFDLFYRGPHVLSSSVIGDVALASCSAVHMQLHASSETVQCQRVSGMAAPSRSELVAMVAAKEVAKARDHRLLGTSMGLFFFDQVSPGSAFFTPLGTRFYNALLQWMRNIYKVPPLNPNLMLFVATIHSQPPGLWIQRSHFTPDFQAQLVGD